MAGLFTTLHLTIQSLKSQAEIDKKKTNNKRKITEVQPTYKPQQPIPKPPVQDEFSTPPSPDTPINVVDDEDEDAGSSSEDKQRRTDAASLNF